MILLLRFNLFYTYHRAYALPQYNPIWDNLLRCYIVIQHIKFIRHIFSCPRRQSQRLSPEISFDSQSFKESLTFDIEVDVYKIMPHNELELGTVFALPGFFLRICLPSFLLVCPFALFILESSIMIFKMIISFLSGPWQKHKRLLKVPKNVANYQKPVQGKSRKSNVFQAALGRKTLSSKLSQRSAVMTPFLMVSITMVQNGFLVVLRTKLPFPKSMMLPWCL